MKALIAMSGGVDSSVAALLAKEAGLSCSGCTMWLYDGKDTGAPDGSTCCSSEDIKDAENIARKLEMPFMVFDLRESFRENVICRFAESYVKGITPNPCIDCNRYMKFGALHEKRKEMGFDYVITGHYARVEKGPDGKFLLKKSLVPEKDQSYVLYQLTQEELAATKFPLGEMSKDEVRAKALENGFLNAGKPDSQDICFVPDGDYAKVVMEHTGYIPRSGDFVTKNGDVIAQHKGIIHYTVGQRRGLGIASSEPYYVCGICPQENKVILGRKEELFSKEMDVKDVNWISGSVPDKPVKCSVKIRYRHKEQPAVVTAGGAGSVHVEFDEAQRAITPGQSAVFYDGDIVLGGGIII